MNFKKWLSLFLCVATLLISATACGDTDTTSKQTSLKGTDVVESDGNNSSEDETFSINEFVSKEEVISSENPTSSEDSVDLEELWNQATGGVQQNGYTTEQVAKGQYSIVTDKSARLSSQYISNINAKNMGKLSSERVVIYDYNDEWSFNHAPAITYFNGKFYVFWGQGRKNEDDLGQRIVGVTSSDFKNWGTPYIISDSMKCILDNTVESVQTPEMFFNTGNELYLYYTSAEYAISSLRDNKTLRPIDYNWALRTKYYKKIDSNGNWSNATETKATCGGNLSAIKLKSGRYVMPASTGIRYNDGNNLWLQSGLTQTQIDDAFNRGAEDLCEASCYETDDGILHLLIRSDTRYLWHTQSADNGNTWSNAYPTRFTNDKSKFQAGRLPDGRYYIVSNTKYGSSRNPLTICISEDGYNFDKEYIIRDEPYTIKKMGLYKDGIYGYPTCEIVGNYFYTVYSVGKEIIEITRFPLSNLK